jgi:hypothetical protein
VLFDIYNIDISNLESTLTKNQARTLLKNIFPREISSWQIYQFMNKYGIEDESYKNYDYDTAHDMFLAMKEASKDPAALEHSLQVIDDVD